MDPKIRSLSDLDGLERFESIKSIPGVFLNSLDFLYNENRFTLGRASVIIHDKWNSIGTGLFIDTILGYQIGHYDRRHPERLDVSLDFIKFLIESKINHSELIAGYFHPSQLGVLYLSYSSKGSDILPINVYQKIDHKYDDLILEKGGNLDRLKKIQRGNNLLKTLGF
jgi:hypothetical protein